MIGAPAKAMIRIYPQMSQMKKSICENLCSSVDKVSASRPRRALAGAMITLGSQFPGAALIEIPAGGLRSQGFQP